MVGLADLKDAVKLLEQFEADASIVRSAGPRSVAALKAYQAMRNGISRGYTGRHYAKAAGSPAYLKETKVERGVQLGQDRPARLRAGRHPREPHGRPRNAMARARPDAHRLSVDHRFDRPELVEQRAAAQGRRAQRHPHRHLFRARPPAHRRGLRIGQPARYRRDGAQGQRGQCEGGLHRGARSFPNWLPNHAHEVMDTSFARPCPRRLISTRSSIACSPPPRRIPSRRCCTCTQW